MTSASNQPSVGLMAYLRGNKLGNTVFATYDEIVGKACEAWMFLANDKTRIASLTSREWATVNA